MASLDLRVMQGQKVIGGTQDPQVPGERMVLRGQRGQRVWWERRDPQVQLGRRASLGCPVSQVTQDVQDLKDLLDFPGPWDH